jgi:hypothetical protein
MVYINIQEEGSFRACNKYTVHHSASPLRILNVYILKHTVTDFSKANLMYVHHNCNRDHMTDTGYVEKKCIESSERFCSPIYLNNFYLFLLLFGLWGYWHCGHSWAIVPASGDTEDDCGEADGM